MKVRMSEFEKVVEYDEDGVTEDHPDFEALLREELDVFGVRARIVLSIPVGDVEDAEYDGGTHVGHAVTTPGVWGITAKHTGEPHLDAFFRSEAALLAAMLRGLGVEVVDDRDDRPVAVLAVCPRCLKRTGGIAELPEGRRFALELKRDLRIGTLTWEQSSDAADPSLCDVLRSDFAPHHLVAYYGDSAPPRPCSPICQLPADAIEVWTVDGENEADE